MAQGETKTAMQVVGENVLVQDGVTENWHTNTGDSLRRVELDVTDHHHEWRSEVN